MASQKVHGDQSSALTGTSRLKRKQHPPGQVRPYRCCSLHIATVIGSRGLRPSPEFASLAAKPSPPAGAARVASQALPAQELRVSPIRRPPFASCAFDYRPLRTVCRRPLGGGYVMPTVSR
jgi:hypothetical protein